MKKLLLLGGSLYLVPIIEAAHKLGIYVITCDYFEWNHAHKLSDEYRNISIVDKDAVLAAAQEMQIDGIMSFACDPGVTTAAYVAEKMGLPNVGPYESVEILQNKGRFRKFLADNGFNVPVAKSYSDVEGPLKDSEVFNWPVIVKPTDSAGSKGVTKVEKLEDLRAAAEHALEFSLSGEFIVEDFLEQKGQSSDTDSFSVDGELKFVSFDNQYFDKAAENPYTPAAYSWPSTMSIENQNNLTSEIQRLIKLLDMKTAIYNIETRETKDGKAYIMEFSPRGGGNRLAECLRYATGVDMITNMVKYTVGLPMDEVEQRDYDGYWCEIILHSEVPGIFDGIWIAEEIRDCVVDKTIWFTKGDKVGGFSAANEAIGTLILRMNSQEDVDKLLQNQKDYVKVVLCEK